MKSFVIAFDAKNASPENSIVCSFLLGTPTLLSCENENKDEKAKRIKNIFEKFMFTD
jgi:hypothetical protein